MCFFKRLIYTSCSHALFLGPDPVRKCHMQLAYEDGETDVPCGKMWLHSYTSLRVHGACHKCGRTNGALTQIRAQLQEMRMRLNVPGEQSGRNGGVGGGHGKMGGGGEQEEEEEEEEERYGEETLSPVKLSFRGDRGGGRVSEDGDGSVSSLSLDGAALSAVGLSPSRY